MSDDDVDVGVAGDVGEPADTARRTVAVDEYNWADFMREHGFENEAARARSGSGSTGRKGGFVGRLFGNRNGGNARGSTLDWASTDFDPAAYLGFPPDRMDAHLGHGKHRARVLLRYVVDRLRNQPVAKDQYSWEHFMLEYYYDDRGLPPRDETGRIIPFDPVQYLGFPPERIESWVAHTKYLASELGEVEAYRTVNVNPELDEDAFFSTVDGHTTLVNRYDLEKSVTLERKQHFNEVERY
ncbi:MAG: hypothetical protein R3324_19075, partial [Halobacteriales archaeon]|nr:hypothetical protein [Halobacteriales archaeon]